MNFVNSLTVSRAPASMMMIGGKIPLRITIARIKHRHVGKIPRSAPKLLLTVRELLDNAPSTSHSINYLCVL